MLSDAAIRKAKPASSPYKVTDSHGLHLYVTPAGARLWRLRYTFGGREKLLSLGAYPDVGLADARILREQARAELRAGTDPAVARKLRRAAGELAAANTFEAVARAWHAMQAPAWTERHAADVLHSLQPVFEAIGTVPIAAITPPVVLGVLRPIEARPALETARRVRQRMSSIFVHAISSGIAVHDPAAIVKGAMAPLTRGRQPAITDLEGARAMLASAEAEPAHACTRLALRYLALTAVRPSEVRGATWSEIEGLAGDAPLWRIPKERMKMGREHLVPLSAQAVAVLQAMRPLRPARGGPALVFPSSRHAHRPLSENALGYLLHRAGFHGQHVPHGWRATFSSCMNERYPADRHVLDLMLAHAPKDAVEAAYNRALHMARRRELAQAWADLLLAGAAPAAQLLEGPHRSPASRAAQLNPGPDTISSRAGLAGPTV